MSCALAEASLPTFNIPYREILAFHVKNRENGKTVNFPVVTIPCKLLGFSQTQIEVDVMTFLMSKVPLIYREFFFFFFFFWKAPYSVIYKVHYRNKCYIVSEMISALCSALRSELV